MPWQPIFPFLPILQVDANCLHMTICQKYTMKQADFYLWSRVFACVSAWEKWPQMPDFFL